MSIVAKLVAKFGPRYYSKIMKWIGEGHTYHWIYTKLKRKRRRH